MAYCRNCGVQIHDDAVFCPSCGVQQKEVKVTYKDTGSIGWAILGFLIPVVGLVLWLVWIDEKPNSAKMAGIGALVCVILSILISIFGFSLLIT